MRVHTTSTEIGASGDAQPIGSITIEQVVRHHRRLYAAPGDSMTRYGAALDDHIRSVFADNQEAEIRAFRIEISEGAAAALRDWCNRGEY